MSCWNFGWTDLLRKKSFQKSYVMQIFLAWFKERNKKNRLVMYNIFYTYPHAHIAQTNIHSPPPLASHSLYTYTLAFSPPKVPFVGIDFWWNNETPWHWKVRFLLPQSCLRTVCFCSHCCASHSTTGSLWSIAGNQRLCAHPSSISSKTESQYFCLNVDVYGCAKRELWLGYFALWKKIVLTQLE